MVRSGKKWLVCVLLLSSCASPAGWRRIETGANPPAGNSAAAAYDNKDQKAILFGGSSSTLVDNSYVQHWFDETWEWDGNDWTKLSPVNSPAARDKHVMTYDELRDRIVLFGGSADGIIFNDTWEWDGSNWEQRNPRHSPPARCCHAMAYDSSRKQIVLYGGWDSVNNVFFNDIWLWDGDDWSQIDSSALPMSGHALVDYPPQNRVISIQTANGGTWAWDGRMFSSLEMDGPPSRTDVRAVFDPTNNRIVLFGGIQDKTFLNDTWVFDGQSWSQIYTPFSPSPRFGQVMFYNSVRGSIVLFGGFQSDSPNYLEDTWELRLPENLQDFRVPEIPTSTLSTIPVPSVPVAP